MDTAYTYTATDGTIRHVNQYRVAAGNPGTLPGIKGSYATLGQSISYTYVPFVDLLTLAQAIKSK